MKALKQSSMKCSLMLMFFVTSVLVLSSIGVVAQLMVKQHFVKEDTQFLNQKHDVLVELMKQPVNTRQTMFELFVKNNVVIWLVDNEGLIYQNSTALVSDALLNDARRVNDWSYEGVTYRTKLYTLDDPKYKKALLGLSIDHHLEFYRSLKRILLTLMSAASLFIALACYAIVRRGFKPMSTLQSHLAEINTENMDNRLEDHSLPEELQQLVMSHNQMLDRLEQGFQRLSDFSSDIAHELKTPLANITTQSQVILSRERSVAEYQDALCSNLEEIERLSKTINDTLYLAKSENRLLSKQEQVFELGELMAQSASYYGIMAEEEAIQIEVIGQAWVTADKAMMARVINNLLSNAIRHAAQSSTVFVSVVESCDGVILSFINQGETISSDDLPYIFNRFYRADKSRQHSGSVGAGLGLAIVRSIVEAHQGWIRVDSKEGITEFKLWLPTKA